MEHPENRKKKKKLGIDGRKLAECIRFRQLTATCRLGPEKSRVQKGTEKKRGGKNNGKLFRSQQIIGRK